MQISALLESIKNKPQYLDRLVIKAGGRITFLSTRDVNWIEADDKYVHLHTNKGSPMVRQTLSAMETQLDPTKFRRIHRSAIRPNPVAAHHLKIMVRASQLDAHVISAWPRANEIRTLVNASPVTSP